MVGVHEAMKQQILQLWLSSSEVWRQKYLAWRRRCLPNRPCIPVSHCGSAMCKYPGIVKESNGGSLPITCPKCRFGEIVSKYFWGCRTIKFFSWGHDPAMIRLSINFHGMDILHHRLCRKRKLSSDFRPPKNRKISRQFANMRHTFEDGKYSVVIRSFKLILERRFGQYNKFPNSIRW